MLGIGSSTDTSKPVTNLDKSAVMRSMAAAELQRALAQLHVPCQHSGCLALMQFHSNAP